MAGMDPDRLRDLMRLCALRGEWRGSLAARWAVVALVRADLVAAGGATSAASTLAAAWGGLLGWKQFGAECGAVFMEGQPQVQPASGSNQFGITFMSAPYIPHLTKPSGKDTMFLTLSGTRSSNPEDEYANVPTDAERMGDFPRRVCRRFTIRRLLGLRPRQHDSQRAKWNAKSDWWVRLRRC